MLCVVFDDPAPEPTACHACGHVAVEYVCSWCGTERAAYTALKNISESLRIECDHAWVLRKLRAPARHGLLFESYCLKCKKPA